MTPLRRRMIDAMVLRRVAARTQETYVSAVSQLARHHHRSPELLSDEQVRAYLLHLLQEQQRSRSTVNITACAMRFLVCDVLGQTERRVQIPLGKRAQRLPEVLSRAEVAALLDAPMSCKARTLLMTAYASGLRLNELCHLRGCDIDSAPDCMCVRVVNGKGGQDRFGLLDAELLAQLRLYWRACRCGARAQDWLLPASRDASRPLDDDSAQRYYYVARDAAGITKAGGIHTLRHYSESRKMPSSVGKTLAAGGIEGFPRALNSAYSGTLQSLEKGHQLIVGPEPSDSTHARFELVESGLLDLENPRARICSTRSGTNARNEPFTAAGR